ncbi:MAG: LD-carboxypeptidase [Hyphomonadaceae bacterium]|nr:LD-carboxypeptidase [Hyphomonadaceae bacterium]
MDKLRIAIVAPGAALVPASAEGVRALAAEFPGLDLHIHPQCFAKAGHFAGPDEERARAFLDAANDPAFDAVWFAAGGYGASRLFERILPNLAPVARAKTYLGYSDAGALLAALHNLGFPRLAHGPMPVDFARADGPDAIRRALAFLLRRDPSTVEPQHANEPRLAFNLTVLCHLLGTPYQPNWDGAILMLEDVGEYHYRLDRFCFGLFHNTAFKRVKGVMLGRCDPIPENDRPFGQTETEIVERFCAMTGIPYLGRADIGHDAKNKIVPFRPLTDWEGSLQ